MAASVFDQILDFVHRPNPYPLYARLRETPVSRQEDGTYVVSTYREIVALLHDPRVSSDQRNRSCPVEGGESSPLDAGGSGPEGAEESRAGGSSSEGGSEGGEESASALPPGFITLDPPEHDRVRRLMTRHFGPPHTPDRVDGMRPALVATVTRLIDGLATRTEADRNAADRNAADQNAADQNEADLVDDVAYPFPVTVICELLGVPPEDEPRFRGWNETIVESIGPSGAEAADKRHTRAEAFAQLGHYLGELADEHSRHPGDDLLSGLVTDHGDGDEGTLSRGEILSNASLLLFAGHETTVNLIANGMLTLLRHPELLDRLRADPTFAVGVVEELLRYEPPVHFLPSRVALADIEVAGTTIPAGAPITLALAAGSRDPLHVREPDRFDPDRFDPTRFATEREGNQHLGFGGGVHYCFGAPLARLEAQVALSELSRRLEGLRLLADPPPYRPNAVLRGPRHLPVAYDRVAPVKTADIPAARTGSERVEEPHRSGQRPS